MRTGRLHVPFGTPKPAYDPIFGNNTWAQIDDACTRNAIPDTWTIGSEKNITLSTSEVLTLQIYGRDHDDLAAGGKAKITLGMKNLMAETRAMNSTSTNVGGFTGGAMYTWLTGTLWSQLPEDLRAIIKTVNKKTSAGNQSATINTVGMTVFLFSEVEMFNTATYSAAGEGTWYSIFTDNASRIKYLSNGVGVASHYWTRSPRKTTSTSFCGVHASGALNELQAASGFGVCFGVCIGGAA